MYSLWSRKTVRAILTCWLVVFILLVQSEIGLAGTETLYLEPGQSHVYKPGFVVRKLATGNPQVCETVRVSSTEFLINARGTGRTNILLWDGKNVQRQEIIVVVIANKDKLVKDLKEVLKDIEGISVRAVGERVMVEGEVFSQRDFERVQNILKDIPAAVNLVKISSRVKEILASEIEKSIGNSSVKVRAAKDSFLLEGTVFSKDEKNRAEQIAKAYSPAVINVIQILTRAGENAAGPTRMVQVTLSIMALDRGVMKDFGVHWNPGGTLGGSGSYSGASGQKSSLAGAITGTISSLFPKMQKLSENGKGRSLFQQTAIAKNGGHASFFVGDEVPIAVAQEGGTMSIEYKKVGITLNFSPIIDAQGNVDTNVEVESSIITGEGAGGAPTINTTRLQTSAYVSSGESIALGGIIGQHELQALSGSPPAGTGPSLYQSNKSESQLLKKSEVLVFITPEILQSAGDAVHDLGTKVKSSFKDYERRNISRPQPRPDTTSLPGE